MTPSPPLNVSGTSDLKNEQLSFYKGGPGLGASESGECGDTRSAASRRLAGTHARPRGSRPLRAASQRRRGRAEQPAVPNWQGVSRGGVSGRA